MSERPNPIAALLNSDGGTGYGVAASPSGTASAGAATGGTGAPIATGAAAPVTYDVRSGHGASHARLRLDSSPDALISVDGHRVAAGDDGLSLDIAPDGTAHVTHAPPAGSPPAGQSDRPAVPGGGTGGAQPAVDAQTGHGDVAGRTPQPGTSVPDGSGGASGQHDVPIEHLKGHGAHAAQADLALHAPGTADARVVKHMHKDGGYHLTVPKGHGNPHDLTVHVKPNADGSLDITVPKGHGVQHEIKAHVQPGKHVDLNITRDAHGHIKIDAHDHKPGQKDDWPGLKQPAGQGTPGVTDPSGKDGAADSSTADPSAAGLPKADVPQPSLPKPPTPGDGGLPRGGGSPGGGGLPGGGSPYGTPQPKNDGLQTPLIATPYKSITPDSLKQLAKDLESGPGSALDEAHAHASAIQIGFPGAGAAGIPMALSHGSAVNTAADQLSTGRKTLTSWVPALNRTADNWTGAENQSNSQVNGVTPTG